MSIVLQSVVMSWDNHQIGENILQIMAGVKTVTGALLE
jgi:hypothetical protein